MGKLFKVSFFGESHGKCVGTIIEGCPPGIEVKLADIKRDLERRKPRRDMSATSRIEEDRFEVLSGIFKGFTTGTPITIVILNRDVDSTIYEKIRDVPRPSHADYVARIKYFGFNDYRGGGIFSGRITAAFVAAGAIAKRLLGRFGIKILAHIVQIGNIRVDRELSVEEIEANIEKSPIECADPEASRKMVKLVRMVGGEGDSVGGVIEVLALNVPIGFGDPPIDTLEGDIAKAVFAIPAVKGIEFGAGFKLAEMKGSEANDQFTLENGRVITLTNNSGGIVGGISNGMPIRFRVVVKPTPSILKPQRSVDLRRRKETVLKLDGRFDSCIVIRAVPVVEAASALVLADHLLRWLSWRKFRTSDEE